MIKILLGILLLPTAYSCSRINYQPADYSYETFSINTKRPYKYAIFRDRQNADDSAILYYLHCSDGDETTWLKSHWKIIKEWKNSGKPVPVVAGISFGKRWLLLPEDTGREMSGSIGLFVNEIIPLIEKQAGLKIQNRYIMGVSLGGINAAQIVFRHPDLFKKGVIVSPLIYPISLYSDNDATDRFISDENTRTMGLNKWIHLNVLRKDRLHEAVYGNFATFRKKYYPDPESWERGDILLNMNKSYRNKSVKIYISCGEKDEFGFYPGAEKLARLADADSFSVTWHSLPGGHMVMDEKEIADFLNK